MENIFYNNWEQELAYQFVTNDKSRKRAYICSPLSDPQEENFVGNMYAAREYMFYALKTMDLNTRAPHAYLPMLLRDHIPEERVLGLVFGLRLLECCDLMLICGNRVSNGMRGEIERAAELGLMMVVFHESLFEEVRRIVIKSGGEEVSVCLDLKHPAMAVGSPATFLEQAVLTEKS